MTRPGRHGHRRLRDVAGAIAVFGAGFALVWYGSSRSGAPEVAERAAHRREVQAPAGDDVPARGSERLSLLETRIGRNQAERSATEIRKSRLPEWMRFRVERPPIALSTEMAVRLALDADAHVAEVKAACAARQSLSAPPALDISAEIEIRGREVTVRSWGCDTEPDDQRGGAVCECLVQQLPGELSVTVPPEVRDDDLAPYDGMLSLRL